MLKPQSEGELSDIIRARSTPLSIKGGGTRLARDLQAETLSVAGLAGVKLYEPGALTLVVGAGTPLAEVETLLAKEGQGLPFEPPLLGPLLGQDGAPSIGGVVAANASGPRRISAGACRDVMLGLRFVDGSGTVLKSGGRVMKNVTGYDLVKLLTGSWGTLGVITEVSLKVLPSLSGATLALRGLDALQALDAMTRGMTSPYEVSGAAMVPGEAVYLRVEGLESSVTYRVEQLKALMAGLGEVEIIDEPAASADIWARLRDVRDYVGQPGAVWRVSMKPSDLVEGLLPRLGEFGAFDYRLDWAGGLAWLRLDADDEALIAAHSTLQTRVTELGGGHATLMRAPQAVFSLVPTFQPEAPGLAALSRGLRDKFDPMGILNPGLMGA